MKRRTWLFIGAGFGFSIPILLNALQRFGPWHVRPVAHFLFRPGLILLMPVGEFLQRTFGVMPFLTLLILVVNALVFGGLAYGLQRGFLVLIALLLIIIYVSLPPSDTKLERRFAVERVKFEQLIQKANETPSIVKIGMVEIEDTNGRKYREGDKQSLVSPESWAEYREIFKETGMQVGLFRSPQTGQMQFLGHTLFGKIGPIGTLYGYVYCPASSKVRDTGFVPCSVQRE